jgi:hypothetical protein
MSKEQSKLDPEGEKRYCDRAVGTDVGPIAGPEEDEPMATDNMICPDRAAASPPCPPDHHSWMHSARESSGMFRRLSSPSLPFSVALILLGITCSRILDASRVGFYSGDYGRVLGPAFATAVMAGVGRVSQIVRRELLKEGIGAG